MMLESIWFVVHDDNKQWWDWFVWSYFASVAVLVAMIVPVDYRILKSYHAHFGRPLTWGALLKDLFIIFCPFLNHFAAMSVVVGALFNVLKKGVEGIKALLNKPVIKRGAK